MKIIKLETNYRRNLFFHETTNIPVIPYSSEIERSKWLFYKTITS